MASKSYEGIWKNTESLVNGEKTTPFQTGTKYNSTRKWWFFIWLICHFPFKVLLIAEDYFQNKYVLISLYFLLLYSDSLMAVYYGTVLQKVQYSKRQNANRCSCIFKLVISRHTLGSFGRTFGSPLKNCDFCRLSLWNNESKYWSVIAPTSSKNGI